MPYSNRTCRPERPYRDEPPRRRRARPDALWALVLIALGLGICAACGLVTWGTFSESVAPWEVTR